MKYMGELFLVLAENEKAVIGRELLRKITGEAEVYSEL